MKMLKFYEMTVANNWVYYFKTERAALQWEDIKMNEIGQFVYDTFLHNIHIPNSLEDVDQFDDETLACIAEVFDIETVWDFCKGNKYLHKEFCDWFGFEIREIWFEG